MNEITASGEQAVVPTPKRPLPAAEHRGVRGWLLALCLMFTVVGPAIALWVTTNEYAVPDTAVTVGSEVAASASVLVTACSVAFGIYAGLGLWLIRPKAVRTAKNALLFGLAADISTTTIEVVVGPGTDGTTSLLHQIEIDLIPSVVFFALCFAYLNRSKRVHATYGGEQL